MDISPVDLATTRVDVDLAGAEPALSLPEEATDPEEHDDGEGEVGLEETFGVVDTAAGWADGHVELGEGDVSFRSRARGRKWGTEEKGGAWEKHT